jgi:hypothetical protein
LTTTASSFGLTLVLAGLLTANARAQTAPSALPPPPPPPPAAQPQPPSPPSIPPAAAPASSGPEVTVVARDGATFRGQLIEKIPGQYVTLRLPNGEPRRIMWWFIESLIGPDGQNQIVGPVVKVQFRADDERAALQKLGRDGEWFDACLAPCNGAVSATGTYRVAGDGIRASESFKLPPDKVRIEAEVGTRGRTVGGAILAIGGGVIAYVGAIVFLVGLSTNAQSERDGSSRVLSDEERDNLRTTGGLMVLGGGGAAVGGLFMLLNNKTDVQVLHDPSGAARNGSATQESVGIRLSPGLYLTERGLAF